MDLGGVGGLYDVGSVGGIGEAGGKVSSGRRARRAFRGCCGGYPPISEYQGGRGICQNGGYLIRLFKT